MNNMSDFTNAKPAITANCAVYMRKGPSKSTQEVCVINSGETVLFEGRDKNINNERWIYATRVENDGSTVSGWTMAEFYDTSNIPNNIQNGVSKRENHNGYRKEGK